MIIDGRKIADDIMEKLKMEVTQLPFQPVFCDVLVGNNPASIQYITMKTKRAESVGFKFRQAVFKENITTENLILEIKKINDEPNICGLIVQLPLPKHIDLQAVLDSIDPRIDVDCVGKTNSDLFYNGKAYLKPPTAEAICELLDSLGIDLRDKKILVMGQGQLVGKPASFMLKQREYMVDIADEKTENILDLMKEADVIISAVGKPKLITGEKIKRGTIIIDAGTSESGSGIVGDVDFESVKDVASLISPVPGGVGPVTVARLLYNVLKVAKGLK